MQSRAMLILQKIDQSRGEQETMQREQPHLLWLMRKISEHVSSVWQKNVSAFHAC